VTTVGVGGPKYTHVKDCAGISGGGLLTVCVQSSGRNAHIACLLSVMTYQLLCKMADVVSPHGTGSCVMDSH